MIISVPDGATEIIYTTSNEDPRKSDEVLHVKESMDLAYLVKDKAGVIVKMRALDEHGNASDVVTVEVINKAKKYEVAVDQDLFGKKGSFKFPDNVQGLIAVMKSLIKQGVAQSLLTKETGEKLEKAIHQLLGETIKR
jgi:hypothetical protein